MIGDSGEFATMSSQGRSPRSSQPEIGIVFEFKVSLAVDYNKKIQSKPQKHS